MKLQDARVIFLDCQTTGMHPGTGSLLEIAWAIGQGSEISDVVSSLVELPADHEIPWRVQEITGIKPEDLANAKSRESVLSELRAVLPEIDFALIHYAQFERPFLNDLFAGAGDEFPVEIFCTYKMTKKLFPALPSRNIRGVSGFFGNPVGEVKRASSHVTATTEIWQGLREELAKNGIEDRVSLADWLAAKAPTVRKAKPKPYEYRIEKEKRLGLPEKPGVYRMVAKTGEILYVGKATSLRDRVNSYFRGRKGRDPRKLEMLTQVWDLNFTECGSALEAAILETDEIKRLDPPYNVSLKRGKRKLIFYSRDFEHMSSGQDVEHPLGAFRTYNAVEDLRLVLKSITGTEFAQVFHVERPQEVLTEGFEIFSKSVGVAREQLKDIRSLLALGTRLFRDEIRGPKHVIADLAASEEVATEDVLIDKALEVELTPEEAAVKFHKLFVRAGRELWRAKRMTRLLNSRVEWQAETGKRTLEVHGGQIASESLEEQASAKNASGEEAPPEKAAPEKAPSEKVPAEFPWLDLDIGDYDRMSVLFSGIAPVEHSISKL